MNILFLIISSFNIHKYSENNFLKIKYWFIWL